MADSSFPSFFMIFKLVEILNISASMIWVWLAPLSFSKDNLASSNLPLEINQGGVSGQKNKIMKLDIGIINPEPIAYLHGKEAPKKLGFGISILLLFFAILIRVDCFSFT